MCIKKHCEAVPRIMFGIIERYAVARSNTTDDANADTRGNLGLVQEEKC